MQKVKKIPQRQCVGCRTKRDKKDLLRIVKTPEGEIVLDATGKRSGRGVYVCPDPECLRKARKSRGLERAVCIGLARGRHRGRERCRGPAPQRPGRPGQALPAICR